MTGAELQRQCRAAAPGLRWGRPTHNGGWRCVARLSEGRSIEAYARPRGGIGVMHGSCVGFGRTPREALRRLARLLLNEGSRLMGLALVVEPTRTLPDRIGGP